MLERYEIDEQINFMTMLFKQNGAPEPGQVVRVTVTDLSDGVELLTDIQMQETAVNSGVYNYIWTHGFLIKKDLAVKIFEDSGNNIAVIDVYKIVIDNFKEYLTDKNDENDGHIY